MDIINNLCLSKPAVEMQRFMDSYGIIIDDCQKQADDILFSAPKYLIKFSIPESWEHGLGDDKQSIDAEMLKLLFKEKANNILVQVWTEEEPDCGDDLLNEALHCITYLCRTRKGETWTRENRNNALSKTNAIVEKFSDALRKNAEYKEV